MKHILGAKCRCKRGHKEWTVRGYWGGTGNQARQAGYICSFCRKAWRYR